MTDKEALAEREARRQVQERFLAVYDEVKSELLRIPGVVEVGVGLRERGGALTAEPVFRVYVEEKLPEAQVPSEHRIPREIKGFPTDVLTHRKGIPILGFNDENDDKNYNIKVGGTQIGIDVMGAGTGTLGCFATLNSDNSTVILSCHHVLMQRAHPPGADPNIDIGVGVGQPDFSGSCCCTCNEIAKNVAGDRTLDCAIARLKPDVRFAAEIRPIKKPDGSTELPGFLVGSDNPVFGDEVWKVGARTGLTRGTVSLATPRVEIHPLAPFPYFADHGDSGSVVVHAQTVKVVGLLKQIDKEIANGGTLGFATPIGPILAALGITIQVTDQTQISNVRGSHNQRLGTAAPPTPAEVFAVVADRLAMTEAGAELLALYRRHKVEIGDLVNHCRPVTVAWQRNQGPAFLAAVMRSIREPIYRLPDSLNGVTRAEIAQRLRAALTRHGSEALRADLDAHADTLIRLWLQCSTFDELIRAWESAPAPALLPA